MPPKDGQKGTKKERRCEARVVVAHHLVVLRNVNVPHQPRDAAEGGAREAGRMLPAARDSLTHGPARETGWQMGF